MNAGSSNRILEMIRGAVKAIVGSPVTAAVCVGAAAILCVFTVHGAMKDGGSSTEKVIIYEDTSSAGTVSEAEIGEKRTTTVTERKAVEASATVSASASETSLPVTSGTAGKSSADVSSKKESAAATRTAASTTTARTSKPVTETSAATEAPQTDASAPTETTTETTTQTETTTEPTSITHQQFPADINTISYEGLLEVPGIGEVFAGEIISLRNRLGRISDMSQLLEINGIGEERLAAFSGYLYVTPQSAPTSAATEAPRTETTAEAVTGANTEATSAEAPDTSEDESSDSEQENDDDDEYVHINTADAEEIMDKLGLSEEQALDIIDVREKISRFSAIEELLLVDSLTKSDISEIKDRIVID